MKNLLFFIGLILCNASLLYAQKEQKEEPKKVNYTSERTSKNEEKYPGALLMYKVDNQVEFTHEGIKVWSDEAIFYQDENFFRASGNVKMVQGDTITLTSDYAEYDGTTEFAFASNDVKLTTPTNNLTTDSLFFDRQKQEAFYRDGGTVRDTVNTITSRIGRYYMNDKKYSFRNDVVVTSEDYVINSDHTDYYTENGQAYLYGPSTVTSENNKLYCERGFYDTQKDYGHFVKNSKIYYDNREMEGDSLYFNREKNFASATNNIKVIDTTNETVASGHYAEIFNEKDSVFITKRALVSRKQTEEDSIHIHSDTIMVTGKPDQRIIRSFYNAKLYKNDMNGRADSIYMSEEDNITKMIGKPVVFSDLNQMTGDTIELYNDPETNKLDSLSVFYNAFLNQKDSIDGYNQVKGKIMYGLFKDNDLDEANFIKNTETIYYWRDDEDGELIGINKAISSAIQVKFEDNNIRTIEYREEPENITHKPSDFPENARKLRGFIWRGDERILSKAQLFDDDPPIALPKIKGIPLPEEDSFFDESDEGNLQPKLNEKSRLAPDVLKNKNQDSLPIEQDSLKLSNPDLLPKPH